MGDSIYDRREHFGLIAIVDPVHANDDAGGADDRIYDQLGQLAQGPEDRKREQGPT